MPEPRVLLFSFDYPPKDGGISRLCAELVAGLQRKGVSIQVLSQRRHGVGSWIPSVQEERVTMRRPWRELAALRSLLRAAPAGEWTPLRLRLRCFEDAGADMSRITPPLRLETGGTLILGFADVRLVPATEGGAACP